MKKIQLAVMLLVLVAFVSLGATFNITGDPRDQTVGLNSSFIPTLVNATTTFLNVCDDNYRYNQGDSAGILVFQLPDLGGEGIAAANLTVYWDADYISATGPINYDPADTNILWTGHPGSTDTTMPKWCDLYGLRYDATNTVTTNDYGYKAVVGAGDTLIQEQFLYTEVNEAMNPVPAETDLGGDTALTSWLQAQYDAGAVAGDYVFLRVHGQFDTGNGFKVSSGNNADTNQLPVLTITTGAVAPTGAFNASPASGWVPLTVSFNDVSAGDITNRTWDFGDGATTNTTLTSLDHTYTSTGTYTVALTVSGALGTNTITKTDLIEVTAPILPTADFSASATSGRIPLDVTFTDSSTGDITNRYWDFGDGSTTNTTATSVDYTYTTIGTFTVSQVCSGPAGSDTNTQVALIVTTDQLPEGQVEIFGDPADITIGIDTNGDFSFAWINQTIIQSGDDNFQYGNGEAAAIMVFQLPDLEGKTIGDANLSVMSENDHITGSNTNTYPQDDNILPKWTDLYGIRYSSSGTVLTNDYGFRTFVPAGDTLIQTQFILQAVSEDTLPAPFETSDAGDAALAVWLQAQYDAGAVAGDYVFLRSQSVYDSLSPFKISSANSDNPPVLLLTLTDGGPTEPPAPFAVAASAALGSGADVLNWTTEAGYTYSVWYSTNLLDGFQPLETNLDESVTSLTNLITTSPVFYKIEANW